MSHYTLSVVQNSSAARGTVDVGTVIADTYTIEALLGRGGMGSVFLASHNRLPGKKVAIKMLHPDLADEEVLARFKREAQIATQLDHPNIVRVDDFITLPDGTPCMLLEYLQGETLAQRLRAGPLPLEHALSIVRQVGSALSAAHRAGIVHRDLKPQNIFLVASEHDGRAIEIAKVLDFGISKIRGSQTVKTQESSLLGTPQYMAPEQATGQHAAVDERTDVFAFGSIVYEMLAGQPAFQGASIPEVVFKVVYEQPASLAELVPALPASIVAAVARAMAKPLDERFATVGGFVEALTGQALSLSRGQAVVAAPGAEAPSRSRRAPAPEAYAQTMGPGDHGDAAVNPLVATAAPGVVSPVRALASSAAVARTQPPSGPANPAAVAAPTVDLHMRGSVDQRPPRRRSAGVIAALALAGSAVAAVAVFVAVRPASDHHEISQPAPPVAAVQSASPKPADVKPADPVPGNPAAAETKSADPAPSDPKPADGTHAVRTASDAPRAGDKPSKPTARLHDKPTTKLPAVQSAEPPSPGEDAQSDHGDSDREVNDKLAQAGAAMERKDFDAAERLVNAVINSSAGPKPRATARMLHGQIQCIARNDQEGAQIDLRSLEKFRALRIRLLNTCSRHGVLLAP